MSDDTFDQGQSAVDPDSPQAMFGTDFLRDAAADSADAGEGAEAKVAEQQGATGQEPEPRVKFRGREYTRSEFVEMVKANPNLVDDLVQTYSQFPSLQKRYQESQQKLNERLEQQLQQQQQGQKPPQADQPRLPSAQEFMQYMTPDVMLLHESGRLSKDFIETFPVEAACLAWGMKSLQMLDQGLRDRVLPVIERVVGGDETAESQNDLLGSVSTLAGRGGIFSVLNDQAQVAQFLTHVATSRLGSLDRSFLRDREAFADLLEGEFMRWQKDNLLRPPPQNPARKPAPKPSPNAGGEASGARRTNVRGMDMDQDIADTFKAR